jgi:hypothetical protein
MDTFDQAQAIRGLEMESIKAMCLFASRHTSKADRAAIKEAWDGVNPQAYARATKIKPTWFDGSTDVSKWELLSLIKIAGVSDKYARALLAEDWQHNTMSFEDVRARVDGLKSKRRKRLTLKERVCGLIAELEHDSNNGAEMIVKATKQAVADRLREMIDA